MSSTESIADMAQTMAAAHGLDLHAIVAELTRRAERDRPTNGALGAGQA